MSALDWRADFSTGMAAFVGRSRKRRGSASISIAAGFLQSTEFQGPAMPSRAEHIATSIASTASEPQPSCRT
jgi:hypothetical protein